MCPSPYTHAHHFSPRCPLSLDILEHLTYIFYSTAPAAPSLSLRTIMLRCAIASARRTPHAHSAKGSNPVRQPLLPIIFALTISPAALTPRAKPAANCGMPERLLHQPLLRTSLSCCPQQTRAPTAMSRKIQFRGLPPHHTPRPTTSIWPPAPAANCGMPIRLPSLPSSLWAGSSLPPSSFVPSLFFSLVLLRVLRVLRGAFRLLPHTHAKPRCWEAAPERASLTTTRLSRIVGSPTSPTDSLPGRNGTFDTRPPGVRRGILHMTRSTHCDLTADAADLCRLSAHR